MFSTASNPYGGAGPTAGKPSGTCRSSRLEPLEVVSNQCQVVGNLTSLLSFSELPPDIVEVKSVVVHSENPDLHEWDAGVDDPQR